VETVSGPMYPILLQRKWELGAERRAAYKARREEIYRKRERKKEEPMMALEDIVRLRKPLSFWAKIWDRIKGLFKKER